jgi:hypothetical protein
VATLALQAGHLLEAPQAVARRPAVHHPVAKAVQAVAVAAVVAK